MPSSAHVALMIWWCEGTKPRRDFRWKNAMLCPIEVINSDPRIIKIFVDYLRNDFHIDPARLKGQIQIHEGDNVEEIESFWEKYTGIPRVQFNKTIIRKKGNRKRNNYGTFKVRFYDKKVYYQLEQALMSILDTYELGNVVSKLG